jgi:hypothetical protein
MRSSWRVQGKGKGERAKSSKEKEKKSQKDILVEYNKTNKDEHVKYT